MTDITESKHSHAGLAWVCSKAADEIERLREALNDAATSLNTIAEQSGKDEFLTDIRDIRAYAANRAAEARKAALAHRGLTPAAEIDRLTRKDLAEFHDLIGGAIDIAAATGAAEAQFGADRARG